MMPNKNKNKSDSRKELDSLNEAILNKLDNMVKKEQNRYDSAPLEDVELNDIEINE